MNIFYPDNDKRVARVHELQTQVGVKLQNSKSHLSEIQNIITTLGNKYIIPNQTSEYTEFILEGDTEIKKLSLIISNYEELSEAVDILLSVGMIIVPFWGIPTAIQKGQLDRNTYIQNIGQLFSLRSEAGFCEQQLEMKHTHLLAILKALQAIESSDNPLVLHLSVDEANEKIKKALHVNTLTKEKIDMRLVEQDRQNGSYTADDPIF